MGTYWDIHVGPYLVVRPKDIINKKPVRTCEGCDKPLRYLRGQFCSTCGGKIVNKTVEEPDTETLMEAIYAEKIKIDADTFSRPPYIQSNGVSRENYNTYMSNVRMECDGQDPEKIDPDRIDRDKLEFKTMFELELVEIRKYFGDENVSVEWGVIHHGYQRVR